MPELCQDQTPVQVHNYNGYECVKPGTSTYSLSHINFDFYNKGINVVVQVFVKEIKDDPLDVIFEEKSLTVYFKTRSKGFLKLHVDSSEETLFKWHVNLRHPINSKESTYEKSKGKVTIVLKKQKGGKWNSLYSLCDEETTISDLKSAVNGGSARVNTTVPNCSNGITNNTIMKCAVESEQNLHGVLKTIPGNDTTNLTVGTGGYGTEMQHQSDVASPNCSKKDTRQNTDNTSEIMNGECVLNNDNERKDLSKDDSVCDNHTKENRSSNNNKNTTVNNCISFDVISDDNPKKNINVCQTAGHNGSLSNGTTLDGNFHGKCNDSNVDDLRSSTQVRDCSSTCGCIWEDNCSHGHANSSGQSTVNSNYNSGNSFVKVNEKGQTNKDFILNYNEKLHHSRPGFTGLRNLRNMCYINSIVQCLSAVRGLRQYMLSRNYYSDINRKSEHGFKGNLVECFGSLLTTMWSGKERLVSANKLKEILGRKHIDFDHVGQQDAQEFLTFFLDGLHEDLKNEKNMFIEEQHNECQKNILEDGIKYWQKFINGNQSIIVDLFYGQIVSEIICRDCKKPSVQFDPLMQLNLPLPNESKYLSIYVFFLDPASKPLQVKLKIADGAICSEILSELSQLVKIPANHIVLINPSYNRIARIFDETDDLSYCRIKEYLIACQVVKNERNINGDEHNNTLFECNKTPEDQDCTLSKTEDDSHILRIPVIQRSTHRVVSKCSSCSSEKNSLRHCSKCFIVAYCNSECQASHWKTHRNNCKFLPECIGFPFILSIPASQATLDELKKKALLYSRLSVTCRKGELENVVFELRLLKHISDFHSKGETLLQNGGKPAVFKDDVCMTVDWDSRTADQKVQSKQLDCDDHDSVKRKLSTKDKTSSLEECLNLYWKPEIIRKETGWRCDHCKDVRSAGRKVKIFRHPKNMIIHFKRFSYEGNGRKIKKDVSFPLRGLDMSQYTYHQSLAGKAVYDLNAVCTHQGFMDYGHYVTYAKPYSCEELDNLGWTGTGGWLRYNDCNVACVAESQVEKVEAYILFYQRRDERRTNSDEPSEMGCNFTNCLNISDGAQATAKDHVFYDTTDLRVMNQTETSTRTNLNQDESFVQISSSRKGGKIDDITSCNKIHNLHIRDTPQEDELD